MRQQLARLALVPVFSFGLCALGTGPRALAGEKAAERPRVDAAGDPLPPGAVARLGSLRLRHGATLMSAAISPDGRRAASTGTDRSAYVWDIPSGRLVRECAPDKQGSHVLKVAFSPDGKRLAVATDPEVLLWDLAAGKVVRRWAQPYQMWSVAFSPDGKVLAWGTGDSKVRLADLDGGEVRELKGHEGRVFGLAFSPDGKRLASGGWEDKAVVLWELASGRVLHKLDGHGGASSVQFAPGGATLASCGEDGLIRLWDAASGKERGCLKGHGPFAHNLSFSADGKLLLSSGYDHTVRLWGVEARKEVRTLGRHTGLVYGAALSPDGKTAVSGGDDHRLRVWDVAAGKEVFPAPPLDLVAGSLQFGTDGQSLVGLDAAGKVRRWTTAGKERDPLGTLPGGAVGAPSVLSPDGKTVAMPGPDSVLELWDVVGVQKRLTLKGHKEVAHLLAYSADGRLLASAERGALYLWDVAGGKELRRFPVEGAAVTTLALSPGGKHLAAGGWGHFNPSPWVRVFETATGKEVLSPERDTPLPGALAFAPDGRTLAMGLLTRPGALDGEGRCTLWEVASGRARLRLKDAEAGRAVAFSPDGRILACGSDGGAIRLWDVATGRERQRLAGHRGRVNRLTFSPDGRLLASAGDDTTALVWEVSPPEKDGTAERLSAKEVAALWEDLAAEDAAVAGRAVWKLAGAGGDAVAFLRERLAPAPRPDAKRIDRLIAELDSDDFQTRQRATAELEKLGESAASALRRVAAKSPSVEVRRRAEELLARLTAWGPEGLRVLRAVEALEHAGGPNARRLLKFLAGGAPEAWLTVEAEESLARLDRVRPTAP
jgi:WD40 repeat protein